MVFTRYLQDCGESGSISVDAVAYPLGDLVNSGRRSAGCHLSKEERKTLACWLMSTMAISFRSMSSSNVDSIVAVSVLLSTTRKFFFESAPVVAC